MKIKHQQQVSNKFHIFKIIT